MNHRNRIEEKALKYPMVEEILFLEKLFWFRFKEDYKETVRH